MSKGVQRISMADLARGNVPGVPTNPVPRRVSIFAKPAIGEDELSQPPEEAASRRVDNPPARVATQPAKPPAQKESLAPAVTPVPTRAKGLLSGMREADIDVRVACNAIKTLAPAVAACGDPDGVAHLLERAEAIAVDILNAYGIVDEEKVSKLSALLLPTVTDMLASAYIEDPAAIDDAVYLNEVAATCARLGASKEAQRMMLPHYKGDTPEVDLRITMISAAGASMNEIILFRFSEDIKKDIDFCTKTVLGFVKENLENIVPPGASKAGALMMAQSLTNNAHKVFSIAWRRQAFLISNKVGGLEYVRKHPEKSQAAVLADFKAAMSAITEFSVKYVAESKEDRAAERPARTKISRAF